MISLDFFFIFCFILSGFFPLLFEFGTLLTKPEVQKLQ